MRFSQNIGLIVISSFMLLGGNLMGAEPTLPPSLQPEPHQRDPYDWQARHKAVLDKNKEAKPYYVMIGDSITHRWGGLPADQFTGKGAESWNEVFGNIPITNMGFGFDYVDNAYYRVQNGELDGISPKVIIVLIGTNNLGHRKDSPEDCAANTKALLQLIRQKSPKSKILLLGILPRKEKENWEPIEETNKLYAKLADRKTIFYADLSKAIRHADKGAPDANMMADVVHPNAEGYKALGKELMKQLAKLDSNYAKAKKETK